MKRKIEESREFKAVIRRGRKLAMSRGEKWAEEEHILLALLYDTTNSATKAFGEEVRVIFLEELEGWSYDHRKPVKRVQLGLTFCKLIGYAKFQGIGDNIVLWPEHFLLAVLHCPDTQLRRNLRDLIDRLWGAEGFHQIRRRLVTSIEQRSKQLAQVG